MSSKAAQTEAATADEALRLRERHIVEWSVYANTVAHERDLIALEGHVTEGRDSHAETSRALIVKQLTTTAETLSTALRKLSSSITDDDALAYDVGLDSVTQQETLRLHIQSHTTLAAEIAARDFDKWRLTIASAPRASRRTRNVALA